MHKNASPSRVTRHGRRGAPFALAALALGLAAACSPASSGDPDPEPQDGAVKSVDTRASAGSGGRGGSAGSNAGGSTAGAGGSAAGASGSSESPGADAGAADASPAGAGGSAGVDAAPAADVRPAPEPWKPLEGQLPVNVVSGAKVETYVDLDRPAEGPSYIGGNVYACGSQVIKVDKDKKRFRYQNLNCAGSFALADGSLLVSAEGLGVVQVLPDDKWITLAKSNDIMLNDLTVDANGVIYATMLIESRSIWRVTPAGAVDKIAEGLNGPNGIEVDPESKYLYVALADGGEIVRYPLPAAGAKLANRESVMGGLATPDGLTFDGWGNLWVALYGSDQVVVIDVKGKKRLTQIGSGVRPTTNVTFGGPNRDQLFITGGMTIKRASLPGVKGFPGHPGAAMYKAIDQPKAAVLRAF